MEKQVVVYDILDPKKHSIRYDTTQENPVVSSIYVQRSVIGGKIPKRLKMTLEEVD